MYICGLSQGLEPFLWFWGFTVNDGFLSALVWGSGIPGTPTHGRNNAKTPLQAVVCLGLGTGHFGLPAPLLLSFTALGEFMSLPA